MASSRKSSVPTAAVFAGAIAALSFYIKAARRGGKAKAASSGSTNSKGEWVNPLTKEANPYETSVQVSEYLQMHFAKPHEIMPYEFGPKDALEFPMRCARTCFEAASKGGNAEALFKLPALDIGCAVGRSTFELARYFKKVVGIDYSHAFIAAANNLKKNGVMPYEMVDEGVVRRRCVAEVHPDIDRARCHFEQGDACNLDVEKLGQFGVVLAANLVCRLPKPSRYLQSIHKLIVKGGLLVMPSPYTWLEQYTPKEEWIGGYYDKSGKPVAGIEGLKKHLLPHFKLIHTSNMPFFIRETARKNQWSVSHLSIWRRV